jgi:hypothetical protein
MAALYLASPAVCWSRLKGSGTGGIRALIKLGAGPFQHETFEIFDFLGTAMLRPLVG